MGAPRSGPGGVRVGALLLLGVLGLVSGLSLEPVYWNSANKRFQAEGGYVLYPQIGDRLDLLCPRARPPGPHSSPNYEFYKLYLVGGAQGRRCEAPPAPNLLLTCDRPDLDLRFTIKFQEYSPNLWGHEFRSHHDYYIIATSDGTREGLESLKGGVCLTRGMKVLLRVGQSPRGGAAPRKPVSEIPMERDRGAAHSLEPGKENMPGLFLFPSTSLPASSFTLSASSPRPLSSPGWGGRKHSPLSSLFTAPLSLPKMGALWGRLGPSTPAPGTGSGASFSALPQACTFLLRPIWGGWVVTAAGGRSVLFCQWPRARCDPVGAHVWIWSDAERAPLGTGSDLLQTRSARGRPGRKWPGQGAGAVQQELEVPSSRTGSSASEIDYPKNPRVVPSNPEGCLVHHIVHFLVPSDSTQLPS
ncbi:ephrin-B3 isoform X2 [Zalophus californianus]|uniref:Ephrin-B3 n=1 Tax=Zalophus californianus TaxID=9704 RepID=A0A6J2AY15_ZALCA|nr:ephrin-B3 isoform X2 [Zalophus californianus]